MVAHSGPTLNPSRGSDEDDDEEGDAVAAGEVLHAFLGRLEGFRAALLASGESLK